MTIVDGGTNLAWPSRDSVNAALRAAITFLPAPVQDLARTLSIAVSVRPGSLLAVHNRVADVENRLGHEELSRLLASPLVETAGERVRLIEPLDVDFGRDLRVREPERFERLHTAFAEEEAIEQDAAHESDIDSWQVTARLAYYLAAQSPGESATAFLESFDAAPHESRKACRYWLADLAERYSAISGVESRVTMFFRAFRLYVSGDRAGAKPLLTALIESDAEADGVSAVSAHLLALCLSERNEANRKFDLLEMAVSLSIERSLLDNLLMSRQSLVWQNVTFARRRNKKGSLSKAHALARSNDALADEMDRSFYQCWTRNALAVTSWLDAAGLGTTSYRPELDGALSRSQALLAESRLLAEGSNDLFSWVVASVSESSVLRSMQMFGDAIAALEQAIVMAERARAVADLPIRQFQAEVDRLQSEHDGSLDDDYLDSLVARLRRVRRRS